MSVKHIHLGGMKKKKSTPNHKHSTLLLWCFLELKRWKYKWRSKSHGATNSVSERGIKTLAAGNNTWKNHDFHHCRNKGIPTIVFHEFNNSLPLCFEEACPLQPCLLDHAKTKGLINLHKKIRNIPLTLHRLSIHLSFSVSYYMCITNLILSLWWSIRSWKLFLPFLI